MKLYVQADATQVLWVLDREAAQAWRLAMVRTLDRGDNGEGLTYPCMTWWNGDLLDSFDLAPRIRNGSRCSIEIKPNERWACSVALCISLARGARALLGTRTPIVLNTGCLYMRKLVPFCVRLLLPKENAPPLVTRPLGGYLVDPVTLTE